MIASYVGRQVVVDKKTWLVTILAESQEEAEARLANGEGVRYAYIESEELSAKPVTDVHERIEEMGW